MGRLTEAFLLGLVCVVAGGYVRVNADDWARNRVIRGAGVTTTIPFDPDLRDCYREAGWAACGFGLAVWVVVVTRWVWRSPTWVRREMPPDGPAPGGGWVFAVRAVVCLLAVGLLLALARRGG